MLDQHDTAEVFADKGLVRVGGTLVLENDGKPAGLAAADAGVFFESIVQISGTRPIDRALRVVGALYCAG